MNMLSFNKDLFTFLQTSTSPYHAVSNLASFFSQAGFKRLQETEKIQPNHEKFFLIRDDGSFICSKTHGDLASGFRILATHTDSPALQIKPQPDMYANSYHRLGVEVYGGPLLSTWFDRPLGIAGRVHWLKNTGEVTSSLFDSEKPVAVIPSLAIHLSQNEYKDKAVNKQKDILPLTGLDTNKKLSAYITENIEKNEGRPVKKILGSDLFLYDNSPPVLCGLNNEFIVGSRLDNLLSCYVSARAALSSPGEGNYIIICSNHEEIGSTTQSGADGNFLLSFLERLIPDQQERYQALAKSLLISVDNAHATHPSFSETHDQTHPVSLNRGPVIKKNANHRYATTSGTSSLFSMLAEMVNVEIQYFVMRNDMRCGSTIGPMTSAKLGIQTVDVGIPSLAMHSIQETTGVKDPWLMYTVLAEFLHRKQLPVLPSCI